jgi:RNA polymerase sigma-70 factor (ECF subfamily)
MYSILETDAKVITLNKNIFGISRSASITDEEFVAFIKEYETVLYKIAYQYVRNEHDAKDMVSETVYKGYKARKSLKQPDYFRTWITKILISVCLNYLKRNKKVVVSSDETLENIGGSYDAAPLENNILIDEALSRLKYDYKTVLLLRYYQDLSIRETSAVMDIPENTVKTYTDRALKQLRKILKEDCIL